MCLSRGLMRAGVVCRQVDAILTVVDAKHIVQHLDEVPCLTASLPY